VSGYVALRRPLPEAVVTCFVTSSRMSSLRSTGVGGHVELRARRDHTATTAIPGAGAGIAERLLPTPVKVRPSYGQSGLVEGHRSSHQEVQRVVRGEPIGV
jgi:hypothetical protein